MQQYTKFGVWAVVTAAIVQFIRVAQKKLIYFPRTYSGYDSIFDSFQQSLEKAGRKPLHRIGYNVSGVGDQTAFLILPKTKQYVKLLVFFGGNAMLAMDLSHYILQIVADQSSVAILLVDYPGYGYNKGQANPDTTLKSSLRAVLLAVDLLDPPKGEKVAISLFGHSLGGAAALQLATTLKNRLSINCIANEDELHRYQLGDIIVSSTFTSLVDMALLMFRLTGRISRMLVNALVSHRWNNMQRLSELVEPSEGCQNFRKFVVVHSPTDSLIPVLMAQQLVEIAEKARTIQVQAVMIDGFDHNEVFQSPMMGKALLNSIKDHHNL